MNLIKNIDLKDDEIIISEFAAKKYNYKINDYIEINHLGNTYNLKIKSIEEDKGLLYFKNYSAVLKSETFNKIFNTSSKEYLSYYIDVDDDENINNYNDYIMDNNKDVITQKLVDEEKIEKNNQYVSMILIIIFVMSVIMIFFVVSTLNKLIVMERTPVIATFRSIGSTKKRVNAILVLENVMYGLIGGSLGAITSLFINKICIKLLTNGFNSGSNIPLSKLIIGIIFAIVLELLMSIGAIIKSNKYSIKELMFDNPTSKYEINKKTTILSILCILISLFIYIFTNDQNIILDLLKITLFWVGIANIIPLLMLLISKLLCIIAKKTNNGSLILASKNIGYNKMLISSSRLVVISISIMLVILNISSTFDKMLDSFSYQFSGYDMFIRETSKQYNEYERLSNLDEVKEVTIDYMTSGYDMFKENEKLSPVPILLGMKEKRADIEELNYKISNLKEDEILVDEIYLNNNNLKIDDRVNLKIGKEKHNFTIVGTINSFYYSIQRDVLIVNQDYFKEKLSKVPFQVLISINDNYDIDTVIDKIELELKDPDIVIMTVDDFVNDQRANIHTIMYLFYIIIGLAIALSFIGIINNQIINFIERTKEIAILNSVCMSKKQLRKMLFIENITSNISSSVIGFISSVISVKIINSVLNGIGLYINVKFNIYIAIVLIMFILVILLTTIIIPINKLRKINIVETIKYE